MSTGFATFTDLRCPQCGKTAQVKDMVLKSARMHRCPKLRGILAPMVREDIRCEIVLNEREDYAGERIARGELQLDPERKRPVMNMETRYVDGHTDLTVFAPVARANTGR